MSKRRWPEGAIVYQVYPRSFYDSNGDGIGDIPGVTSKLDYLKSLGVNVVWLSPFYPSPMADFGYDVADYCDVDPIFGNLDDMKALIKSAHAKGIKIMADLVPNHSSDEHEWFRQSRQSREGQTADWYIWRDPKGIDQAGKPIPPNNWLDIFTGETAWEWEPARQQFYLHSFDVHQPDLNWTNPEVRAAIKNVMRFWLDLGVDGFRVDAVRFMGKDPMFNDNPPNPDYSPDKDSKYGAILHKNNQGWPQLFAYLAEMAAVLKEDSYLEAPRFMVTESYPDTHEPVEEYMEFYAAMDPEVAAPFNFEGISLPWQAQSWRQFLGKFHDALEGLDPLCVASYAFGNHDQHRLVTRRGEPAARAAAVLLLTLPGMVFVYNGEEIGMKNGDIPPELIQDPGAGGQDEAGAGGPGGRDPERTPLQWTPGKNAGFSTANSTWLPVADNYKTHNIETESKNPDSFLSLYRQLGQLRNQAESIKYGKFQIIEKLDPQVLGYSRIYENQNHVVLINFSDKVCQFTLPAGYESAEFVLSSDPKTQLGKNKDGKIQLLPSEGAVFQIK